MSRIDIGAMTVHEEQVGRIEVRIAEDAMSATLFIPAALDVQAVTVESLAKRITEAGIVEVDAMAEMLNAICEEYGQNQAAIERVIAEGILAVHGEDGRLEWVPGFDPTASAKKQAAGAGEEAGSVNFYDGQEYVRVEAGANVATLHPPREGTNGRTVQGKTLKAKSSKPCPTRFDSTLQVDADGRVTAQCGGVLMMQRDCVSVVQVLNVPGSVDFSTGNIDFDGSVTVRDGVRDRFIVKSSGDIVINGLVESAKLLCGGNLICRRGMAGKDRGQILVGGDAEFGYMNNVRGQVNGSLTVRREIVHCDLVVGGECNCEQACMIGGRLCVSGSGKIGVLGSDAEQPTEVRVGAVPLLSMQHKKLETAIAPLQEKAEELQRQLDVVAAPRSSPQARSRSAQHPLQRELDAIQQQLEELKARKTELEERIRRARMVDFHIRKLIYPKVTLRVGDMAYCFETSLKGPIVIGWNVQRELQYRQASGWMRPLAEIARQFNRAA